MCLLEISKKDKEWRFFAYMLTNDKMLADDLVQEMYLKIINYKDVNDFFVKKVIKNLYFDYYKKNKLTPLDFDVEEYVYKFELSDEEIFILDNFNKLDFHKKELLKEIAKNKSLREIARETNINYGFIHREVVKAKEEIKLKLKNYAKKKE